MPAFDLSAATLGRVAGQDVDALVIANQLVWEAASTADGPYFLNDAVAITPTAYDDGTPNIVAGHLVIFHNSGFVTGVRWFDGNAAAGNWTLSLWLAISLDGNVADAGGTTRLASKVVTSTGEGYRNTVFDAAVEVQTDQAYIVSRYSSSGHYVHHPTFIGSHGAYSDADPVYAPDLDENLSFAVPGWTSPDPITYKIGSGDVVPNIKAAGAPYYGLSPIFYKSL